MSKIAPLLYLFPLFVIIYQNCGSNFEAQKDLMSSTSGIDRNASMAEKEILVRINSATSRQRLLEWSQSKGMTHEHEWADINTHHFSWTANATIEEMIIEAMNLMPDEIDYAEPNYMYVKESTTTDFRLFTNAEVTSSVTSVQTAAPIQFKESWPTLPQSGIRPIIAIIDSGIDATHSVFVNTNSLWRNSNEIPGNGIDDDGNGYVDDTFGWDFANNDNNPSDDEGHGTHVAGIVLGTGQNIFTNPLTASNIQIMVLKFLAADGGGKTSDAIQAIYYAVNNGARVINNSWGGNGYSQTLLDAIGYAYSKKVLFVAAAGNDGKNIDSTPIYPASYTVPNVLAVAATNNSDQVTAFSNYGIRTVQIAAPGLAILSTYPPNRFANLSGTSMATPFVAGTAALIAYERPEMNGYQMKTILVGQSDKVMTLSNSVWGSARLNVLRAVNQAKIVTLDANQPSYTAASSSRDYYGEPVAGCGVIKSKSDDSSNFPTSTPLLLLFFLFSLPVIAQKYLRVSY